MKIFKSLFAAASLTVAINGAAHAAPPVPIPADTTMIGQRVFTFTPNASTTNAKLSQLGQDDNAVVLGGNTQNNIRTTINVPAYLYVIGNLGGTYMVEGWGQGTQTFGGQQLDIYHNKALKIEVNGRNVERNVGTFNFFGFQVPLSNTANAPLNGSTLNGDAMPEIINTFTSTSKGTYSASAVQNINSDFDLTNGFQHPGATGGHVKIGVSSKITVVPGTTAGNYSTNPTVTFNTL